ncbi:CpsD/CapB family tyrosine-protein kinase [Clostridium butyricum]|uniref:non-specific protein-tyrosine kinase n=1 Tax=Clostridium butyricum E4 str. BoNT E BL5262 TaxID=632245 RepID=C4IDA0_CLOBU|nr:CpsD/CapB family tyrosine-protein kinase [Clostridium butyricum]APF22162.1 capsular exopolysaccharide family domain protein [Clostridium butyricum]EDT76644.1 tyrosine-protein kinase etk [Clostridium butyricum 5521]EEP55869.1 tyrosine-protein kinase etk [Clostridium butyricum E4 str. BoNT E BL5262]NFL31856.1 CpsD/CapB family tyrosine-protein kinase [Clostridium butyricum]NFS19760.1 CpsD/CapB family tyrosine-protein kinase [Clostridium butyricum]
MFFKSKLEKAVDKQKHMGFVMERKPKSVVSEAYRTLRTNIQYSSFDKKIQTIVVTSAEAAEGKSTVSGNLALAFAQNEKRVIIVDCDLRKPSVHKNFKVSNLCGLSEVLIGKSELNNVIQNRNEHLDILTSGKIPPNPSEMLSSSAMTKLIETLKEEYDVIILDSAPLGAVTDAQILSTKVDGTILVTRAERTKREIVLEAKNSLEKVGANILGCVLHAVENTKGKYYYYYGTDGEHKKKN